MTNTSSEKLKSVVQGDIPFIHLLRAMAVIMVMYDHFVGQFLNQNTSISWQPKVFIDTYLLNPLGIIQSFGFMGVSIFFLVSGYIITHVALSEDRKTFALKRVLRIYPPLIVSVLICIACIYLAGAPLPKLMDILLNFTLFNYLSAPQVVIQGVAWSLAIEVIFYLLTFLLLDVLKRASVLHILLQTIVVALAIYYKNSLGDNFFLFVVCISYLPFLLAGQIFYFWQRKRMSNFVCFAMLTLQFALMQWGLRLVQPDFLRLDNSYLINFIFSFFIFSMFALANVNSVSKWVKKIAEISYSIYLLHGSIGLLILGTLIHYTSYLSALITAIIATLLLAKLSFHLCEKPSQRLARYLLS